MVALAIVLCAVVALLAVLVAGLLRSHADILKALHDLGVGVGDPAMTVPAPVGRRSRREADHAANAVPLTIGPPLPGERDSVSAPAIGGIDTRRRRACHLARRVGRSDAARLLVLGVRDVCGVLGRARQTRASSRSSRGCGPWW